MIKHLFFPLLAVLLIVSACNQSSPDQQPAEQEFISDSIPFTIDSLRSRAVLRMHQDSLIEALQDIDIVIENDGLNVQNGIPLSEIYLLMGKPEQAQRTLYKIMETHPEDRDLFTAMARLFLIRQNYMMCHNYASKAYEQDASFPDPVFYDGLAYAEEGDTAKAINCFSNVLLMDSKHYDAMIQLALLYSSQKNALALKYLDAALQEQPNSTEAMHLKGLFFQNTGNYRLALDTYSDLKKMAPDYIHAVYNSGYIHLVYLAQYDSAAMYFHQAVEMAPDYIDAIYNLGYASELAGHDEVARKYYSMVLQKQPDYVNAIQGIQRVK